MLQNHNCRHCSFFWWTYKFKKGMLPDCCSAYTILFNYTIKNRNNSEQCSFKVFENFQNLTSKKNYELKFLLRLFFIDRCNIIWIHNNLFGCISPFFAIFVLFTGMKSLYYIVWFLILDTLMWWRSWFKLLKILEGI
jgi:hypothetical protein